MHGGRLVAKAGPDAYVLLMTLRPSVVSISLAAALVGTACGAPPTVLTAVDPGPLVGLSGEALQVAFTLRDEAGRALDGEPVSFALVGAPASTTLRAFDATTDSRGGVTAVVELDGEGALSLVASAEGAPDVTVEITIEALPTTYQACADDPARCRAPETCLHVTTSTSTGTLCSVPCASEGDCPLSPPRGVACVNFDGANRVCMRRCAIPADCAADRVCADFTDQDGQAARICIPME